MTSNLSLNNKNDEKMKSEDKRANNKAFLKYIEWVHNVFIMKHEGGC